MIEEEIEETVIEASELGPKVITWKKFRTHYGPLPEEAFIDLETNIKDTYKKDGKKIIIIVWRTPEGDILIDGHHRLKICISNHIPYDVEVDERIYDEDSAFEEVIRYQKIKGRERTEAQKFNDLGVLSGIKNRRAKIAQEGGQGKDPITGEFLPVLEESARTGDTPTRTEVAKENDASEWDVRKGVELNKAMGSIEKSAGLEVAIEAVTSDMSPNKIIGLSQKLEDEPEMADELRKAPKSTVKVAKREVKNFPKLFHKNIREAKKDFPEYAVKIVVGYIDIHEKENPITAHYDFRFTVPNAGGGREIRIGSACTDGVCSSGRMTRELAILNAHDKIFEKYKKSGPLSKYMKEEDLNKLIFVVGELKDTVSELKVKIESAIQGYERNRLMELQAMVTPELSEDIQKKIEERERLQEKHKDLDIQEVGYMRMATGFDLVRCPHCNQLAKDCLVWKCNGEAIGLRDLLDRLNKDIQALIDRKVKLSSEIEKGTKALEELQGGV